MTPKNSHSENTDDVVEIRFGNNYIRTSDRAHRYSAILFLVSQLDLTPEEVTAARHVLGMDEDTDEEENGE